MKATLTYFSRLTIALLLFSASSCTLYTDVQIKKPVDISHEEVRMIKNVLILNRTAVPKGSGGTNVFEAIITGETIQADRQGAIESIRGVRESLAKSLNYTSAQVIPVVFYGGETNQVPAPLPWRLVDSLCAHYKCDALVSLEYFDSNAGLSAVLSNPTIPIGYPANNGNVNVKSVWRMYNPSSKLMIDDFTMNNVTNRGWRSPYFIANQSNKYNTVAMAGYWAGIDYGFRVSEQWILEGRSYWKGGNKNMRYASKSARFNQWDEAFTIWQDEANSRRPKVRARALHNMAIYYERKGDLITALDKARESWGIKHYSNTAFLISSIERQLNNQGRFLTAN